MHACGRLVTFVDGELHGGRKGADDEVDLVLLDQLQRAGRGLARVELVVAHQQFGLAAVEAAPLVDELDGELGAFDLVLRLGADRGRSAASGSQCGWSRPRRGRAAACRAKPAPAPSARERSAAGYFLVREGSGFVSLMVSSPSVPFVF